MEEETLVSNEPMQAAATLLERLSAAASMLEQNLERMELRCSNLNSGEMNGTQMNGNVQRIVGTVENAEGAEISLERRLSEVEHQVAELRAGRGGAVAAQSRKTLPTNMAALLAKQGISASDSVDAGVLDAALNGLSIEQRIAVKSQLLRAGLLS